MEITVHQAATAYQERTDYLVVEEKMLALLHQETEDLMELRKYYWL